MMSLARPEQLAQSIGLVVVGGAPVDQYENPTPDSDGG